MSQCTYRCVVLPDTTMLEILAFLLVSQCTYRCVVLPDGQKDSSEPYLRGLSQCTYRCVVLPDGVLGIAPVPAAVSMHLQVRGAP